jgi:hypothetical protein
MTKIKVTNENESHKSHKRSCCGGGHAKISGHNRFERNKLVTTSTSTSITQTAAPAVAAAAI